MRQWITLGGSPTGVGLLLFLGLASGCTARQPTALPLPRATARAIAFDAALLAPFLAADYPSSLLARMRIAPARLGNAAAYQLVTLAAKTQVTLLLARRGDRYYRLTIFSASIPAEVAPVLRS